MKRKVLVCGATGFIGRNVAESLAQRDDLEVCGTCLNSGPLDNPKIKLIITGNYADDAGSKYYNELVDQIHELKLGEQVRFAYHCFHNKGMVGQNAELMYSLSDAYSQARACFFNFYFAL